MFVKQQRVIRAHLRSLAREIIGLHNGAEHGLEQGKGPTGTPHQPPPPQQGISPTTGSPQSPPHSTILSRLYPLAPLQALSIILF